MQILFCSNISGFFNQESTDYIKEPPCLFCPSLWRPNLWTYVVFLLVECTFHVFSCGLFQQQLLLLLTSCVNDYVLVLTKLSTTNKLTCKTNITTPLEDGVEMVPRNLLLKAVILLISIYDLDLVVFQIFHFGTIILCDNLCIICANKLICIIKLSLMIQNTQQNFIQW